MARGHLFVSLLVAPLSQPFCACLCVFAGYFLCLFKSLPVVSLHSTDKHTHRHSVCDAVLVLLLCAYCMCLCVFPLCAVLSLCFCDCLCVFTMLLFVPLCVCVCVCLSVCLCHCVRVYAVFCICFIPACRQTDRQTDSMSVRIPVNVLFICLPLCVVSIYVSLRIARNNPRGSLNHVLMFVACFDFLRCSSFLVHCNGGCLPNSGGACIVASLV